MTEHENVQRVRDGLAAFANRDMAGVANLFAEDIVWHTPGSNPLSGEARGREAVVELLTRTAQETGGTFRNPVHDIVGNAEHVLSMHHVTAERNGKQLDQRGVNVFHFNHEGQVSERWILVEDLAAFDDFWS